MALCFGNSHCFVSVDCQLQLWLYLCFGLKLDMDAPCGVSPLTLELVVSNYLSDVAFLLAPTWFSIIHSFAILLILFNRRPLFNI